MEEVRIDTQERPETIPLAEVPPSEKPMPLAWHKFQKNFLLWVVALYYMARAFLTVSGRIYYETAIRNAIYAGVPLLRVLDYAFSGCCIAGAALLIISAIVLNKKNARLLIISNLIMAGCEMAYLMLRWAIAELPPTNLQCAALMVAHVLLWRVNRVYYSKRSDFRYRKEKS